MTLYLNDAPSSLALTTAEQKARVVGDLRMGLPCLLKHGATRVVIASIETLRQTRFDVLQRMFGTPELVMTAHRATAVMTPVAMSNIGTGPVRVRPPENAPLDWFKTLADAGSDKADTAVGPLHVVRNGDSAPHKLAIRLVKNAELLPAVALFAVSSDDQIAGLSMMALDVASGLDDISTLPMLFPIAAAGLPLESHDTSKLHVFRDPNGRTEHYAIEIGAPDRTAPVLSRLHSACFTGDVLGSLKCDCGPQLRAALAHMGEEGAGVLLYLNQEGRGIGLANKMRVYDLQMQGFDTVEANHRLGFHDDERDFRVGAVMLKALCFNAVRLLTNNPAKVETFKSNGIAITQQLPLRVARNVHNQNYLAVKAVKSGHLL